MKNRRSPRRARQGGRKGDAKLRVLVIPTADGLSEVTVRDKSIATLVGRYWNAVRQFLETGDDSILRSFRGQRIIGADGHEIALLTDLDDLERLGGLGVLSFESIYARRG